MKLNRRRFVGASSAGAALAALGLPVGRAGAQNGQPLDTVKIVTGFPPGGTSDTLAAASPRTCAAAPTPRARWSRTRRGRAARSRCRPCKGAPTDGRVILQTPASMLMIYPHIYKKLATTPSPTSPP